MNPLTLFNTKTVRDHYFEPINLKNVSYLLKCETTLSKETKRQLKQIVNDCRECVMKRFYKKGLYLRTYGRYFASGPSLQNVPSNVRGFIADGCRDIDIANACPTFLRSICAAKDIPCPTLADYCDHRDEYLDKYAKEYNVPRGNIKHSLLTLMFGANISTAEHIVCQEIKHDSLFAKLKKEMTYIKNALWKSDIFSDIKAMVMDTKAPNKRKNSFLSIILQHVENECLMKMNEFFETNGYHVACLIFDGLLVKSNSPIPLELLRGCEAFVFEKTGYDVRIAEKEMKTTYVYDEAKMDQVTSKIIIDDLDGSKKLTILLDGIVKRDHHQTVWMKVDDLWISDERTIRSKLISITQNERYVKESETSRGVKYTVYSGNYTNASMIVNSFMCHLESEYDFQDKLYLSSHKKLAFLDGYYNFVTGEFVKWCDQEEEVYFVTKIMRNFPIYSSENERRVDEFFKTLMDNDEETLHLQRRMARASAGCVEDKLWYIFMGRRDSGKSGIITLTRRAFQGYCGGVNSEDIHDVKGDTRDQAMKNGWMGDFEHKRFAFCSEMKLGRCDGVTIKMFSGNDIIQSRKLRKDPRSHRNSAMLFIALNDWETPNPQDAMKTCEIFEFSKIGVEKESDVVDSSKQFVIDGDIIKRLGNDDSFLDAFVLKIISKYEQRKPAPPTFLVERMENENGHDEHNDEFNIRQLVALEENANTPVTEINKYIKQHIDISRTKIKLYLECIGGVEHRIRNGSQQIRVYKNLKIV
jgi:hypothetical protein